MLIALLDLKHIKRYLYIIDNGHITVGTNRILVLQDIRLIVQSDIQNVQLHDTSYIFRCV